MANDTTKPEAVAARVEDLGREAARILGAHLRDRV